MTDRTTLNIDKEEHKATREVKEEFDESWTDVLQFYREHRHELSIPDREGMQEFDWSEFDQRLQDHLVEWELTVDMDQLDLDSVGMDENDVENIIEHYLENNWRDLQQANF